MTQYRFRTWRHTLLSVAFLAPAAWAATEKVHVTGSIQLHLHSDSVQPNDGSTLPVSVWAIDLQQLNGDLRRLAVTTTPESPVIAAAVRKRLQDEVTQRLHKTRLTLPPAVIFPTPPNVDGSLVFLSLLKLPQNNEGSCDGSQTDLPPPAAEVPPQCRVVSFDVLITPVKSITISLASQDTTDPLPPFNGTFVDLASKLHLKPRGEDSSIHFSIRLSQHDVHRDPSGEPDFTDSLRVVDQVREALDNVQGGIGAPGDNGTPFGPLGKFDTGLLTGPFDGNLSPAGKVAGFTAKRPSVQGNDLTIALVDAKFPRAVVFQPAESANAQALAVVEKHHGESFRRRLVGTIVRAESMALSVYELNTDPYVKQVHFKYDKNSLVFIIDTKTVGMGVALSGGAGYRPETNGYGTFAATLDNLGGRGDKTDTKVDIGPNLANVSLAVTIPATPHPFFAGFHFLGLTAGGAYEFNDKTHYQVVGADLTKDQKKMLTGSATLALDSFSAHDIAVWPDASIPDRKRVHHLLTLAPGYEIGLLTTTDRTTQQTLTDGQITAFSAQPTYLLDWDLRSGNCSCGLSELRLQLDSTLAKGGRWLGGDFAYDTARASGAFELTFGIREPHQYLIRGQAGAGTTSRGTPLPRLFQIGGPDYVRGLERGEFTANSLLWQRAEAGPSLKTLWGWIQALRPSHAPPAPCTDSTSSQLPFDLRSSYLEFFYDHARVSQGTSLPNVLDQSTSLQGYGAALELGKVKNTIGISLGYGFSPQSKLHSHGTMFVGVTLR